ncbi:hypothetical protein ACN47E_006113 [Coniothyrium glycines]
MPETVISKYPFILATVATRKEGVTREEFRNHNETHYVPLLKKIAGAVHPLTWTRRYHVQEGEGPAGVPRVLIGSDDALDWDCFGEMTFADELHCQQFITLMHSDTVESILEEEAKFADPVKTKLIVMRRDVSIGERAQVQKLT